MEERSRKIMRVSSEEDRLSHLPEPLLASIISRLPTKESIRTSVLSTCWLNRWKFGDSLSFDQKTMPNSAEIKSYVKAVTPNIRMLNCLIRASAGVRVDYGWYDPICEGSSIIERTIDQHIGDLKSCRIKHMIECICFAPIWMKKLVQEKKVKELHMECYGLSEMAPRKTHHLLSVMMNSELKLSYEVLASYHVIDLKNYSLVISPPPSPYCTFDQNLKTINLTDVSFGEDLGVFLSECLSLENITLKNCKPSFNIVFNKIKIKIHNPRLKVLKLVGMNMTNLEVVATELEKLVIDSVVYYLKHDEENFIIVAPNLKTLHYSTAEYSRKARLIVSLWNILSLSNILEGFSTFANLEDNRYYSIYQNLESLSIELNMRNEKDNMLLSMILKSCHRLQNLEIENEVDAERLRLSENGETHSLVPPVSVDLYWRRMYDSDCIAHQLRRVYIRGFKENEYYIVEFLKHLITNAHKMEIISISFDDDCKWQDAISVVCLLSLPKLSENLKIILQPGKVYSSTVGGSFQNWLSTLTV